MTSASDPTAPIILFGAFDRHNFGDLLFPHIVAALLDTKSVLFAGLLDRDMRRYGGSQVSAIGRLAAQWRNRPVRVIHVGGELLTCTAWEAAVMLLPASQVQPTIARLDHAPDAKMTWASRMLNSASLAPYTLSPEVFPFAETVLYNAVGGVNLNHCEPPMRGEVLANLKAAGKVSVRDKDTHTILDADGIAAELLPDPVSLVSEIFGERIRQHAMESTVSDLCKSFPQGYIAVQFSADFGDDESVMEIARQLDDVVLSCGYGIVFFRAGAAPWHDDLQAYRRVAKRMRTSAVKIFRSLDIWDICSVIACSRAYMGSSLHGRIVAMAFALPRVNLCHPAQTGNNTKHTSYAATWDAPGTLATISLAQIADGCRSLLEADRSLLEQRAKSLAQCYRDGFNRLYSHLWR